MTSVRIIESNRGDVERIPARIPGVTKAAFSKCAEKQGKSAQVLLREEVEAYCAGKVIPETEQQGSSDTQIVVRLSSELSKQFSEKCVSNGASRSDVIRRLVFNCLVSMA